MAAEGQPTRSEAHRRSAVEDGSSRDDIAEMLVPILSEVMEEAQADAVVAAIAAVAFKKEVLPGSLL